jgi:hypothetical protein
MNSLNNLASVLCTFTIPLSFNPSSVAIHAIVCKDDIGYRRVKTELNPLEKNSGAQR